MQISNEIVELVKKFSKSPWDINNGDCEEFALELIKIIGGEDLDTTCLGNYDNNDLLPGHVWVYINGKHYDAECSKGVTNPLSLPIFKRCIRNLDKKPLDIGAVF